MGLKNFLVSKLMKFMKSPCMILKKLSLASSIHGFFKTREERQR